MARLQARIDAEDRIEPNDWMPEAHSTPAWLPTAPTRGGMYSTCQARPETDRLTADYDQV